MFIHSSITARREFPAMRHPLRRPPARRRGSVLGMMAILLPVLAILAGFCINAAYMQLTRTELMVATDAAARAGGRALSEYQTVSAAKDAAMVTAALNTVGGEPLQLRTQDSANEIEFGVTTQPDGVHGRYEFQKVPTPAIENGSQLASAVRVNGLRTAGSSSGKIPLIIPGLLNMSSFSSRQEAVAMQVDRDISLILDRSGSMAELSIVWPDGLSPWDKKTLDAGIPAGKTVFHRGSYYYAPGENSTTYQQWAWEDYFKLGPAPTSPWQDLVSAVDAFLTVLEGTPQDEQVSIASYASEATLDCLLETDYLVVRQTVDSLEPVGATAIGEGMQSGIQALLDAAARPHAAKTMVVMTDGHHNDGIDPVTVASEFMSQYNLIIHTVTFGSDTNQQLMQDVATIGGGKHYHAADGQQLLEVFEEIANNLPTILTQ